MERIVKKPIYGGRDPARDLQCEVENNRRCILRGQPERCTYLYHYSKEELDLLDRNLGASLAEELPSTNPTTNTTNNLRTPAERRKDDNSSKKETITSPPIKKSRTTEDKELDDANPTPNHNPTNNSGLDGTASANPNHNPNPDENILQQYKTNQNKLIKLEHHITFLEESLLESKIPRGLQFNKNYQVMDITEEFKTKVREIQLQAEIQIVNTILNHYRPIFQACCDQSKSLIHQLEEKAKTEPDISYQVNEIDKPLITLKQTLSEKRIKKNSKNRTHQQRSSNFVQIKKQPAVNRHQYSFNRQQRPQYQSRSRNYHTFNQQNNLQHIISTTIQTVLNQMLPFFNQHQSNYTPPEPYWDNNNYQTSYY